MPKVQPDPIPFDETVPSIARRTRWIDTHADARRARQWFEGGHQLWIARTRRRVRQRFKPTDSHVRHVKNVTEALRQSDEKPFPLLKRDSRSNGYDALPALDSDRVNDYSCRSGLKGLGENAVRRPPSGSRSERLLRRGYRNPISAGQPMFENRAYLALSVCPRTT